jgi:hypothetical protein
MAKRFTDTNKWNKRSFDDLSMKMKLVWVYLCDNCDHAGIWDANFRIMSVHIGEPVTPADITLAFGEKIVWLSETKVFIPSFIEFQYGTLCRENRAHLSVINRLEKEGACKPLISPLQGDKDKEKDKDKDLDKEKDGEKEKRKALLEAIYRAYPKRLGNQNKGDGLKALSRQLISDQDFADCLTASNNTRTHFENKKQIGTEFVPQFKTWCGSAENPRWREWIHIELTAKPKIQFAVPD